MDGNRTTTIVPDVDKGWSVGEIENSALVRAIYGLISVVGVSGNLLVCLVLLRIPSLRSNTSDFLVHLAIVDFMVCLWAIPFHLFPHTPSSVPGLLGEIKCRMYTSKYPLWVTMLTSIFNLVVVNLERYVAIVHPHKYKNIFKPGNKYLMLAACWVLAMLFNSYFFLVYGVDSTGECVFVGYSSAAALQVVIGVYIVTICLLVPIVIMVTTQWRVISTLNKQVRRLTEIQGTASQEQNPSKQREMWQLKAAQELQKTLVLVLVTYVVCWTPDNIIYLVFNFGVAVNFAAPYYHICVVLAVCNSCLNPIVYTMKNRPFRQGIKKLFGYKQAGTGRVTPHGDTENVAMVDVIEVADPTI